MKHEHEHCKSTNRHGTIRTVSGRGSGLAKLTNGLAWHGTKTDGLCQARHEINGPKRARVVPAQTRPDAHVQGWQGGHGHSHRPNGSTCPDPRPVINYPTCHGTDLDTKKPAPDLPIANPK
ncbi:unnamed protein product [Linum trigynum]|uniref:Uncharacterized protein n=1 Tax=Linum trigynum TaxID=586398 RepID=A0AAV2CJK1_9ROSI